MDEIQFQNLWVGKAWVIGLSTEDSGVQANDIVRFTSGKSIQIERGSSAPVLWASSFVIEGDELVGNREADGRSFRIQREPSGQVSCRLATPAPFLQRPIAVALSTLVGALAGAVAGALAGSPGLCTVSGLVAALTSSLALSAAVGPNLRLGSGQSWVASDGGNGGRPVLTPYAVQPAGA